MSSLAKIFKDVKETCCVCGTSLTTPNDRHIGDKYYCAAHYQEEIEKPITRQKQRQNRKVKRFLEAENV